VFTGLVEKIAQVLDVTKTDAGMRVKVDTGWRDVESGDSICVNGVCLTAVGSGSQAEFDLSPETLDKTCFSQLKKGDWVNLERSMPANGRFGGHYVTGHVDTDAKLVDIAQLGGYKSMTFSEFGDGKANLFLFPKGSISINGVSLTINRTKQNHIEVMIIPTTLTRTNLSKLSLGDRVNIEFDYFARLIVHQNQMRSIQQEVLYV